MLGRLLAAQADLQAGLDALRRSAEPQTETIASCESQLGALVALQQGLSGASLSALTTMRQAIAGTIRSSQGVASQASAAAAQAMAADVKATSERTREVVQSLQGDLFERRIFDPYLRFNSAEEQAGYRQRETETRRYIEQQLSSGTPEGELNAAGATVGQMLDAHAHGAGESPEFMERWNRLTATTEKQRAAMRADGRSTEEFDQNLTLSVRRYLKAKGLTEAEVDRALGASSNPLDAVKPYVTNDSEVRLLENSSKFADDRAATVSVPVTVSVAVDNTTPVAPIAPSLDEVMATFRAAGIETSAAGQEPSAPPSARAVGAKTVAPTVPR